MVGKMSVFLIGTTAARGIRYSTYAFLQVLHSPEEAEGVGLAFVRQKCPPSEGWESHAATVSQLSDDVVRGLASTLPPEQDDRDTQIASLQADLRAARDRVEVLEVALSGAVRAAIAGGAAVLP